MKRTLNRRMRRKEKKTNKRVVETVAYATIVNSGIKIHFVKSNQIFQKKKNQQKHPSKQFHKVGNVFLLLLCGNQFSLAAHIRNKYFFLHQPWPIALATAPAANWSITNRGSNSVLFLFHATMELILCNSLQFSCARVHKLYHSFAGRIKTKSIKSMNQESIPFLSCFYYCCWLSWACAIGIRLKLMFAEPETVINGLAIA